MKNPLHYQVTEYDCGPTALTNAVSYLFDREEIPPEIIRNIMLYCLDSYGAEGSPGKSGTSRTAMMFLSNWLDGFGKTGKLPISSRYLSGRRVAVEKGGSICDALLRGGVAVVRLYLEVEHYVLFTGMRDGCILMFDPYYYDGEFPEGDILVTLDQPGYNRIVPFSYFNQESHGTYAMGDPDLREAVLLFNDLTKTAEEEEIEYVI